MQICPCCGKPIRPDFSGHRYGGQVLKPCLELVAVAQKPWTTPRLDCIVETGAGSLWVDGARVATGETLQGSTVRNDIRGNAYAQGHRPNPGDIPDYQQHPQGRWPPNFALVHQTPGPDGSPGCRRAGVKKVKCSADPSNTGSDTTRDGIYGKYGNRSLIGYADPDGLETVAAYACAEGCPAMKLDEQAGERKSGALTRSETARAEAGKHGIYGRFNGKPDGTHFPASSGGASRFYFQADWSYEIAEQLASSDPVHYCPKAAKSERQAGLDDFYWRKDKDSPTGFTRISQDEWEALGEEEGRVKAETGKRVSLRAQGNIHPTQKPISLNKWLAALLLPPREYAPRRIMVPFAGKMSEAIGAMLAGWDEIVGIEMIRDYCDAGEARMEFWAGQSRQLELL